MKLVSLASLAVLLLQVPGNPLQQQRPQGSIEGTVTQARGGPLSGARVTITRRQAGPLQPNPLFSAGGLPALAPVTTDDRGKYSFQNLEDGTYTLQVQANGYVAVGYGQRAPNQPGIPIVLAANQAAKDINVAMTPTANVSGRVRDTSDQPLVNVPVQLLRFSYDYQGQRTYQSVGATQTNDRGEYRMYWVTPGRYYVLVGRPSTGDSGLEALMMGDIVGPNGNQVPRVLGYAFYPGVADISNARTLDLQAGADVEGVDLALNPKPRTYGVRGKLIDSRTGQPPPRATVMVATQTPGLNASRSDIVIGSGMPNRNYNAATGVIEIKDLAPGTYMLFATLQDSASPGRPGPALQSSATTSVTLSSADVDGITLTLVPAATIPGRLRIEGQLDASATMDRMRVSLTPLGVSSDLQRGLQNQLSGGFSPGGAQVAADGTFRINNVIAGEYRLEVNSTPMRLFGANGFMREARFEGGDILNTPLRFSGTTSSGLDLVVAAGGGKLTGTVTDVRSQPVPGTQVVLIPDRARFRTDLFRTATTNASGQFTLSAIAPGDYKVLAWEKIEDNSWFDPEVIARFETRGRAVHVTESSAEAVEIRIIPGEGTR